MLPPGGREEPPTRPDEPAPTSAGFWSAGPTAAGLPSTSDSKAIRCAVAGLTPTIPRAAVDGVCSSVAARTASPDRPATVERLAIAPGRTPAVESPPPPGVFEKSGTATPPPARHRPTGRRPHPAARSWSARPGAACRPARWGRYARRRWPRETARRPRRHGGQRGNGAADIRRRSFRLGQRVALQARHGAGQDRLAGHFLERQSNVDRHMLVAGTVHVGREARPPDPAARRRGIEAADFVDELRGIGFQCVFHMDCFQMTHTGVVDDGAAMVQISQRTRKKPATHMARPMAIGRPWTGLMRAEPALPARRRCPAAAHAGERR